VLGWVVGRQTIGLQRLGIPVHLCSVRPGVIEQQVAFIQIVPSADSFCSFCSDDCQLSEVLSDMKIAYEITKNQHSLYFI
jgi:hypothetical protein